jgi:hypothetical protein
MNPFRLTTPTRRENRAVCEHYTSYRKTLIEDFNSRCGYCDDHHLYRIRSFTIDHFVPQKPANFKCTIPANHYYNLIYACRYCNEAKTNKWPTDDEKIHHNGEIGFIEPVNQEYTDLYKRSLHGRIEPVDESNKLAQYIIKEVKLWKPVHERMWKLEKVDNQINLIEEKLKAITDLNLRQEMETLRNELSNSWREIQKGIFTENEE